MKNYVQNVNYEKNYSIEETKRFPIDKTKEFKQN